MHSQEDTVIKGLIVRELRVVNKHLPLKRLSLYELINMETPHVILMDGSVHFFRRAELKKLSSYIEQDEWDKLLLPIIITIRPDIGDGIATIDDAVAIKVVSRILGIEMPSKNMEKLILYKPHLAALRIVFDTIFQYAISVDLSNDGDPLIEQQVV